MEDTQIQPETPQEKKKENPLINIAANIIIPVAILNKTEHFPGGDNKAIYALIVALAFPLGYGLWDYFKNARTNYFSILGLVNTLITGFFAIAQLGGIWFAIKEAAFPFILGIACYASSIMGKPFIKTFLGDSGLLKMNLIKSKVEERGTQKELFNVFKKANNLFSLSFFISAVLNFVLAIYIFKPMPFEFTKEQKAVALNGQISAMTWQGMIVITVPLMLFMGVMLYTLFKGLQETTGLTQEELVNV